MDRGLVVVLCVVIGTVSSAVEACASGDAHPPVATDYGYQPFSGGTGFVDVPSAGGSPTAGGSGSGGATGGSEGGTDTTSPTNPITPNDPSDPNGSPINPSSPSFPDGG